MDLSSMIFILFANALLTGLIFYLQAKEERLKSFSAKTQDQTTRTGEGLFIADSGVE